MPLKLFLQFFVNHGLFKFKNRPQWYTVFNRSRTYVKKILPQISGEIFKNYRINKIIRNDNNVRLKMENEYLDYDHVILASHADQSLQLLESPSTEEKKILGRFKYISNLSFICI